MTANYFLIDAVIALSVIYKGFENDMIVVDTLEEAVSIQQDEESCGFYVRIKMNGKVIYKTKGV